MSVEQVNTNPIFAPADRPNKSACVLCPSKTFKNDHMATLHLKSGSHLRSLKRWHAALENYQKPGRGPRPEDPRVIVALNFRKIETQRVLDKARDKANTQAKVAARRARKVIKKAEREAYKAEHPKPSKQPKVLSESEQAALDARRAKKKLETAARKAVKQERKANRERERQQAFAAGNLNANSVPVASGGSGSSKYGAGASTSRSWRDGAAGGLAKKRVSPRMIRKRARDAKLLAMGIDPAAKTGDEEMSRKLQKRKKKQEKHEKQSAKRKMMAAQRFNNKGSRN
ncbi:hypothetical protein BD324DRAFT_119085 [Kockovaella imperatae]|uniref:Uncharacterized protein n=1 Tax=Kockovaella imperatae TaxID=4999 RepID=A0A1Y1UAP2_9TREE|nr:hypothetical protein BD324DRAFT_119085 [Kockovaella imperatae]ORX35121.1 hypothetical protein BD324DRAFT_119085 [Kockovaella imperatae]